MIVAMFAATGLAANVTLSYSGSTASNMTGGNDAELVGLDANVFKVVGATGGTDHFPALTTDNEIILDWASDGGNELTVTTAGEPTPSTCARVKEVKTIETTKVDDNTYTFVMPDADININATFTKNKPTAISDINADSTQGKRLYVSPSGQVSDRPFRGVNIVIDGNSTYKILK